ncbi:ArsR/SmtB family transcription factor [Streptacidiphilus sp. EB129]|uniref:ArsR/SmtB family transcription factor n=1 Tax=Streptacidiphilus sp. EB129 TaxID=3156262 RepID=UPI0035168037
MGWWLLDADTLVSSRFVVSPLAEATACLFALVRCAATAADERAWLSRHLPGFRAYLAADPVTEALLAAATGATWTADFLTKPPFLVERASFDDELAELRAISDAEVRANLEVSLMGRPLPGVLLTASGLADRAADLLTWIWTETVRPDWDRRRRVVEADIVARTRQLSLGGWAAALDDMRPGMRWLGTGRLQINRHDYPPRDISGTRLTFVPVTPKAGWVAWDGDHRGYAVFYQCSGRLAEPGREPVPEALERLLGAARAQVLVLLAAPLSTTQLVALTGQGLGSVGRHLRVLLDAGLVSRRRAGRSVLYYRTAVGDGLTTARTSARTGC